jgi:predicted transcriptional regulator
MEPRVGPEFYELAVEKIMQKKDVPLIEKNASIDRVLSILTKKTHVWVTETKKSKKVVGVITEHDVLSILSPHRPPYVFGMPDVRALHRGTAEEVMSRRLIKCSPKNTVKSVLEKMMRHGVRRLPVMERDIIVGEVRLYHIIKRFIAAPKKIR